MTMMTRDGKDNLKLYAAFELSAGKWKMAFCRELGAPPRLRTVNAWDLPRVAEEITDAKVRLGLPEDAPVDSCYEAGRDGFSLHRWLVTRGIRNVVVDPASIEVDRRRRRRKTDKLDVIKLLTRLVRHGWGERVWSVVRVPSERDEDRRRVHRERERLVHERVRHQGRIRGLLATQGIRPPRLDGSALDLIRPGDCLPLHEHLRGELERELERMELVTRQIKAVEKQLTKMTEEDTPAAQKTKKLQTLKAIGMVTSQVLGYEFFGWRTFSNQRQVGALAGLTGTPHQSGELNHEQGISKAGNRRIRAVMTELAWNWLRYQPNSALSRWYVARFAGGPGRLRRIGIVALARKLLVALWRFVDQGVLPEGATLTPA